MPEEEQVLPIQLIGTSFPFDSMNDGIDSQGRPHYDRPTSSAQIAAWMAAFFGNGIFAPEAVAVTANGDMSVNIAPMKWFINGRYGELTDAIDLYFSEAYATYPRIDTIVLRLNLETASRTMEIDILVGEDGENPEPPELTRNGSVWELGLADITIRRGATTIQQTDINVTALDGNRCGRVATVVDHIDTTEFYTLLNAVVEDYEAFMSNKLAELSEAIASITQGDLINRKEYAKTLPTSGWTSTGEVYRQSVTITGSGITADEIETSVVVAPGTLSFYEWCQCGVHAYATGTDRVDFEAKSLPASDLTAHIAVLTGGMSE